MADYTLRDGREITFDLYAISYGEYLEFFNPQQLESEAQENISKVTGLSVDELKALPMAEYRLLTKHFFDKAMEPIEDPE